MRKLLACGSCAPSSSSPVHTLSAHRYYGEADVTNRNVGDSWCAMARIALFDARARKVVGGRAARAVVDASLRTLQQDLLRGRFT